MDRHSGGRAYRAKAASGQLPAVRPPDQPEAEAGKAQVATPTAQGLVAGFMAMIVIGAALGALVSPGDDSAVGTSSSGGASAPGSSGYGGSRGSTGLARNLLPPRTAETPSRPGGDHDRVRLTYRLRRFKKELCGIEIALHPVGIGVKLFLLHARLTEEGEDQLASVAVGHHA